MTDVSYPTGQGHISLPSVFQDNLLVAGKLSDNLPNVVEIKPLFDISFDCPKPGANPDPWQIRTKIRFGGLNSSQA